MSATSGKRRRTVASCSQCYAKKQKCNHEFPCNHCIKRRQPELCHYNSNIALESSNLATSDSAEVDKRNEILANRRVANNDYAADTAERMDGDVSETTLDTCLGYFNGGPSSLLSLMQKYSLVDQVHDAAFLRSRNAQILSKKVTQAFKLFPKRQIMDALIQNFTAEVNWIYEMVHPPSFLVQYREWWLANPTTKPESVEFGILLLRIAAYSSQFMPNANYLGDADLQVPIESVQKHCDKLASNLWSIYESVNLPVTLNSVHQLFFQACYLKNDGRMKDSWHTLGACIRVAQELGLHLDQDSPSFTHLQELEKDMRRRTFWNLYLWDRFLTLILDRSPCIVDYYCAMQLPKMHLGGASLEDPKNSPHSFSERLVSIELARVWSTFLKQHPRPSSPSLPYFHYDPIIAQEFYESLQAEFIAKLPSYFQLKNPDRQWDTAMPFLARQRTMLKISICTLVCNLFRPLLHLEQAQADKLPLYKNHLLPLQWRYLIKAALSLLESIATLHELMGKRSSTKFFLLSFFTFEPAILISLYLLSKKEGQLVSSVSSCRTGYDILSDFDSTSQINSITEYMRPPGDHECRQALETARDRLAMFSSHNNPIAKIGLRKLDEAIRRIDTPLAPLTDEVQLFDAGFLSESTGDTPDGNLRDSEGLPWLGLELDLEDASAPQWLESSHDYAFRRTIPNIVEPGQNGNTYTELISSNKANNGIVRSQEPMSNGTSVNGLRSFMIDTTMGYDPSQASHIDNTFMT